GIAFEVTDGRACLRERCWAGPAKPALSPRRSARRCSSTKSQIIHVHTRPVRPASGKTVWRVRRRQRYFVRHQTGRNSWIAGPEWGGENHHNSNAARSGDTDRRLHSDVRARSGG